VTKPSLAEYLKFKEVSDSLFSINLGKEFFGAFNGVFGGIIAAGCLYAGRLVTKDRLPASLDMRFLKSMPQTNQLINVTVLNSGKTLSTLKIDVTSDLGDLFATALAGYVNPQMLFDSSLKAHPKREFCEYKKAPIWQNPKNFIVPIVETLEPRFVHKQNDPPAICIEVPWSDDQYFQEAVCLAADFCVGPPVAKALEKWLPHPNADLSIRFLQTDPSPYLIGRGELKGLKSGLAAVDIEIFSNNQLAAIGCCSSMLLNS
jgi:acyl-coenzyme A thioesterase PaaI-like protein